MGLSDLIVELSRSGGNVLNKNLIARVVNIQDYLLTLTEIRIFIANSQNFGHQASSVNILRNLIRMGAKGPYTLVLSGQSQVDVYDLVGKIRLLIPQFKPAESMNFVLDGSNVTAVEMYPGTERLKAAPFAINGGFDDLEGKDVPYSKLNVTNYVQLQPYAWHRGTNMVRIDDFGLPAIINLDELSPGTNLLRRAFYLDPVLTASDWTAMESGAYKEQTEVCKYLLDQLASSNIFLVPGYGFGTKGSGWSNLYNMLSGIRQSQVTIAAAQKPTVLVAIGVSQTDWSIFTDYVLFGESGSLAPSANFATFHETTIAGSISYEGSGDKSASLDRVKQAVKKMIDSEKKNQKVLVVFLDKVPGPLFSELYKRASLPPFLEGQNTVELMLNLGRPYLKISSNQQDTVYGYPTLPLNSLASGDQALNAQNRAFNGLVASQPNVWYSDRPTYPPDQLPAFTAAQVTPQGTFAKYFNRLGAFFHDGLNDKLLRGLDLFVNMIGPGGVEAADRAQLAAKAEVNVVKELYDKLEASTHGGVLNLLQAITTGDIYDFFSAVVTDTVFRITDANPQINPENTICTLTGDTRAFGVEIGTTKVDFKFTDDNDTGKIKTVFTAAFSVKWSLPGADWLSIADPRFTLAMSPVADVPFMGAISARITAGLSADITLTVPLEPGVFELQAAFVDPRPSISNIFQLVGGINLQQYLPPQLQLFSDIEVETFTTRYNYEQGNVDLMGARLRTRQDKTWDLIPAVVVKSITMNVAVVSPANRAQRKTSFDITGDFAIADASAYIAAYVPNLRVMGGLRDDSKPLDVKAIVKAYLGDEFVTLLPQPVAAAQISRLAFLVDQAAGRYSFGMTVDTEWKIPSRDPLFVVKQLGFDIQATSRAIDTPKENQGQTIVLPAAQSSTAAASNTEITGSFSGNIEVDTSETDKAQISVSANYLGSKKGWTFAGKQTGGEINLGYLLQKYLGFPAPPPEYNYALDGLSLTAATGDGSWAFSAKTKDPWAVPFIPSLRISATFAAGYNPPKNKLLLPVVAGTSAAVSLAAGDGCQGSGKFARVETRTRWNNIDLIVWYDYCGGTQSFGITWDVIEALVKQEAPKNEWIGIIRFTQGTTLGGIVERMVTWLTGSAFALEAPWNVLNSIPLNNLSLEYNFTRNTVKFNVDIGPIELGIARIDSISVVYENDTSDPKSKKGVFVTLKGSFLWNTGTNANGNQNELGPWDTSKPGTAPAPPGNGNKYLDLRLLALGQHVTASCFAAAKNVQGAIDCLASLPDTKPGETPNITFDPQSSWLIGTEFGVLKFGDDKKPPQQAALVRQTALARAGKDPASGYLFTLQIVFNDPSLYALRIALAGPAAKIFKGLDFQIMYRQISESVGVYQTEITLPDVMRNLSIGAYSLTLPVFGIAVYTNGDFQVDVGFPWNENFSRSFTIEGIVYPGIPLLGSAGFYFGKLSSATSNQVPLVTNGTFNPVIIFGFGLQIGVGKSIRYGILSAGFSITVFGIVEGVLAKWNPYQLTAGGTSDNSQLQGAYYFWLRGTVGIIGKIFGTVDFAIIKADVNIEIKVMLQLTYESYRSIAITVVASVSVSVSISIDLGLFSIKISFSFAMRIKETFAIENIGTAPWTLAAPPPTLLRAPADRRLRARRSALLLAAVPQGLTWSNLADSASKLPLAGYFAPGLTIAHNEWDKEDKFTEQGPCYVSMVAIQSVPSPGPGSLHAATAAPADDTSFETLAKMVLRWAIAAKHGSSISWEDVDGLIVTAETLQMLIDVDLDSTDQNPTPIPADAASEFMNRQFRLTVTLPPADGSSDTTFFPIAPELTLRVNAWASQLPYAYQFKTYNALNAETLRFLRNYFDELAVKVQQEQGAPVAKAVGDKSPLSMAEWILSDYFLLIARQMVQGARDALRQFKYALAAPDTPAHTPNGIVRWINDTGDLVGPDRYTLFELFTANPAHPLSGSRKLIIGVHADAQAGMLSFTALAEKAEENVGAYSATDLALANAADPAILQTGKTIRGMDWSYTFKKGDSLIDAAKDLEVSLSDLLINSDVLTAEVLRDTAPVLLPYATYRALVGDSFDTIVQIPLFQSGFSARVLAAQNAGRPILQSGIKVFYAPTNREYVTVANDTLAIVAANLEIGLAELFSATDVLSNPGLIAPVAVILLPPFTITTVEKETLEGIVQRFAISMDVLSFTSANGDQDRLFFSDKDNLHLNIPHLVQFRVEQLIQELQRSLVIQQLSGMVSCYYLHGLRLPTLGITPLAKGIWVEDKDGKLQLPKYAGLYALTGQQIKVPVIPDVKGTPSFDFALDRSDGPDWLLFPDAEATLTVSIAFDSKDAERIRRVSKFVQGAATAIPLSQLGSGVMYESELARYPFSSSLLWQSAAVVNLPYGKQPNGGIPSLRIWRMPDAMMNLVRSGDTKNLTPPAKLPRFSINVARYDEATGTTVPTNVTSYGWASIIEFTVKRVPLVGVSNSNKTTYELVGASGNSILVLERIIDQVRNDDSLLQQIIVGYAPEQTGPAAEGVQTDAPDYVTFGIAQVNLSTITRPPQASPAGLGATAEKGLGLLNTPSEFLQLLWTASITRAGGFYLYYYDSSEARGLPERIFNDRNEAALVLTVIYSAPLSDLEQNRLTNFMNAVAIGESVETSNTIAFAQADPPKLLTLPSNDLGSLSSIGYDYYSDVSDLGEANRYLALAAGKKIVVTEGLYQPPPGPGVPLDKVASDFSTTVEALRNANPRYQGALPDPVVFPTVLNLPQLELIVSANANSTSFDAISTSYGQGVASLAANSENRLVSPIFAANQQVTIPGGPRVRNSAVPPGAQTLLAERAAAPPVPLYPETAGYAEAFIFNNFSLLNYSFARNLYFRESNIGLAAGPTSEPAEQTRDKIVIPLPAQDVKIWEYKQSVPYPSFAITTVATSAAYLPQATKNPYLGVGYLLQIGFSWQDYYGNTLVTTLTSPAAGKPPYDQPPIRTGYTDLLIGLSQWPSIAASYNVDTLGGKPGLQLLLTFDASRYEGLLSAHISGLGNVTALFTQPLDPESAETVANYTIENHTITGATLSDPHTVTLAVDLPADREFVLTVNDVQSADKQLTFSGQATFIGDHVVSSSLNQNARTALRTYDQLYYQWNDPNKIAFSVESTLLRNPIPLTPEQVTSLAQWIFDGDTGQTAIYEFIADRAAWKTPVLPPPNSRTLDFNIDSASLNQEQVFLLGVSFVLQRSGGVVLGELQTVSGITRVATEIAPHLAKVAPSQGDQTVGLTLFATLFQNALSLQGSYRMKVATGVDRRSVTTARNGSVLWVVRIGESGVKEPIAYRINNPDDPVVFAPRPISNQLQSQAAEIRGYETGKGLTGPKVTLNFANIDMDLWGRQFFAGVDGVLTPEFTSAIQIAGKFRSQNYLRQLLEQKKLLASIAKLWMIPAFAVASGADPSHVQEAYYQQMLMTLASAYTTRAALEYQATVDAAINEPGFPITPRLFGPVAFASPRIVYASSDEKSLSSVMITFSAPMEAGSATNPANYAISGAINVLSADISGDGRVVTLALNGTVVLDTSTVTASAAVKDRHGRALIPPRTVVIRRPNDVRDAASEITFSSPKLDLQDAKDAAVPFLVMAPENVRGGGGEIVASLDLNLTYNGTDIEHQISRPEGVVEGYVASTWLSFVIRDADWPLEQPLGAAHVPLPLRSFPLAPAMTAQQPVLHPDAPDLAGLTSWNYDFTYALPVHYPQDRVLCIVDFNIATGPELLAKPDLLNAFKELAQFITVFPRVNDDLVQFLAKVDATTPAGSDEVNNAGVALETTIKMVQDITTKAEQSGGLVIEARALPKRGSEALKYSFYIQECTVNSPGSPQDGALLVTLVGERPANVGKPWVQVGNPAYRAERYYDKDCSNNGCDDVNRFCFVYRDQSNNYLSAEKGQIIPDRIVELPELDLFQRQNAQATAMIKRNVGLAEPFVYTTSDVTFANPLQPTVDSSLSYDIASLGSNHPVKRSLFEQLKNLFNNLLRFNDLATLTFQVEITYDYVLNATLPAVPLPILMQAPLAVAVKGAMKDIPTLDEVLTRWSNSVRSWFQTVLPLGRTGKLHFNLTLMTNLVQPPMPLLWARNLELGLEWIDPPLPTRPENNP